MPFIIFLMTEINKVTEDFCAWQKEARASHLCTRVRPHVSVRTCARRHAHRYSAWLPTPFSISAEMRVFCLKTEEERLFITTPPSPLQSHGLSTSYFISPCLYSQPQRFICSPWPRKLHKEEEEEKRKKNTRWLGVQSHLGLIEDFHIWQIKLPKLDHAEAKRVKTSQESRGGAACFCWSGEECGGSSRPRSADRPALC